MTINNELKEIEERVAGHTREPWTLLCHDSREYDNLGPYRTWESLEGRGTEVVTGVESSLWEATVPDAQLIAAAPDLLRIARELAADLQEAAMLLERMRVHEPRQIRPAVFADVDAFLARLKGENHDT